MRSLLAPRVALLGAALLLAAPAGAQSITFPSTDFAGGNGTVVANGYGAVAGMTTTYRNRTGFGNAGNVAQTNGMCWWDLGYSNLQGVAYGCDGTAGSVAEVGLQALGGSSLTLTGFQIGSWTGVNRSVEVRIYDWSDLTTALYTNTTTVGATAFAYAPATALTSTNGFRIQFTQGGAFDRGSYDAAIDDITFTVRGAPTNNVVPEPSTWALLAGGLGVLGVGARRRGFRAPRAG